MASLLDSLRSSAPTAARVIEYLAVPRRFTREEALRMLKKHVTPNGYNPAVLDVLGRTGVLRSLDGYMAVADRTRLPALESLPPSTLSTVARAWHSEVNDRVDDPDTALDAAYLGLLAGEEQGALGIRDEFAKAETSHATERQLFVARLAHQGASQYGALPDYAQASLYYVLGMSEYHRGRLPQAMTYFEKAVGTGARNHDVAIAGHLLANSWSRQRERWGDAEKLYKDSIAIGEDIGNRFHVAQVEHSYANLLTRQRARWGDAEKLYKDSIQIDGGLGNRCGVAQSEHSYANLLSQQRERWGDAEKLYKDSIAIGEDIGNRFHVAQVEHSYANLLSQQRERWGDAETLYEGSIAIGEDIGHRFHVAQVSFKYGEFLCSNSIDVPRGLGLLKTSLDLNTQMRTQFVKRVRDTYERYSS